MENATAGSVNATLVTLATTVTAPQRRRPAFPMMGRCAAGEAAACAAAVSARSQGPSETRVKNAPPAPMPVALKGSVYVRNTPLCNEHWWIRNGVTASWASSHVFL